MNTETSTDLCICCGKNTATWPRVCEDCIDHEAQAELALKYGIECWEDEFGNECSATGMECRTCGMIYDGGMRCTYCADSNPLDDSEQEEEDW